MYSLFSRNVEKMKFAAEKVTIFKASASIKSLVGRMHDVMQLAFQYGDRKGSNSNTWNGIVAKPLGISATTAPLIVHRMENT